MADAIQKYQVLFVLGGPGSRADDTEEVVRKRLQTNSTECEPIVKKYEEQGMVEKIDGDQPVDTVWRIVQRGVRRFEKSMPTPLKMAKFQDIGKVHPNMGRVNVVGKVIKHTPVVPNMNNPQNHSPGAPKTSSLCEVQVGDCSGVVTATLKIGDYTNVVAKVGNVVKLQNAKVGIFQSKVRLSIDEWSSLREATAAEIENNEDMLKRVGKDVEPNLEQDASLVEYESVKKEDKKTDDDEDKKAAEKKQGKGKGKDSWKGKGKGKGKGGKYGKGGWDNGYGKGYGKQGKGYGKPGFAAKEEKVVVWRAKSKPEEAAEA